MQIGIQSAQTGRLADPAAVRAVAEAAEGLGYGSIWLVDRLGAPAGGADRPVVLDPLAVAATVAAVTDRARLGTSVLVAPWYPPVLLARAVDTLDRLSEHRLDLGLGLGCSVAERVAVGVDGRPGPRLEVLLDHLDAHPWTTGPRARRRPGGGTGPARLLAGTSAAALDRVARRADGWIATGLPLEALALLWMQIRDLAGRHGRDPAGLRFVVRAEVELVPEVAAERPLFVGTAEQVADDIVRLGALGAHEVILGLAGDPGVDEALDTWARVIDAVGSAPAVGPGMTARRAGRSQ